MDLLCLIFVHIKYLTQEKMKKVLLMLAFTGLVGGLSAANTGDDKDKDKGKKECCKKAEAKSCCKKDGAKACSGEKKAEEKKAEEKK